MPTAAPLRFRSLNVFSWQRLVAARRHRPINGQGLLIVPRTLKVRLSRPTELERSARPWGSLVFFPAELPMAKCLAAR